MVTVTCCQLAPVVGELSSNFDTSCAAIVAASAAGADVIVLPELTTSGYCFVSADEARSASISRDHEIFDRWHSASGGAVVVAGFAEVGEDGRLYNSAVLLDATGARSWYRKVHLWDSEQLWFTAGDEPPPVVDTALGSIGFMVCYDLEFPEMTRAVAVRGADLLAVPTNWPWLDRPPGCPAPEVVVAMGAARVNRMAIACCDRRGVERGQHWNEASTIIASDGWPVAVADEAGIATATLELGDSREKRISPRNHLFDDRRPELYR